MIELHVTDKYGKRWCYELNPGETYDLRDGDVAIEVVRKRRRK